MGLELAEIIMEIEDEFGIFFDDDFKYDGTVGCIEEFVIAKYDEKKIIEAIVEIPSNESDGFIQHEKYVKFYNKYHLSKSPFGMFKRIKRTDSIQLKFKLTKTLTYLKNTYKIRERIKEIIKERTRYTGEINSNLRLNADLGAD